MTTEYQPKFSRASLNVLMIACAALIVIFGQTARQVSDKPLPPAPKLNISIWHTDSGAKVWYAPYFSEHIQVQLWYDAGFAFDEEYKGRAQLLAKLLKFESQQNQLPTTIALDQDYLKIGLALSTHPTIMRSQIAQVAELLYRPQLSNGALKLIRVSQHSIQTHLREMAYGPHPYSGPMQGTTESLSSIDRKQLQRYLQTHVHPQRLHASIVGDIDEQAAQVIMESLLPPSIHVAESKTPLPSLPVSSHEQQEWILSIWPGLSAEDDSVPSKQPHATNIVDAQMVLHLLKQVHGNLVHFSPGQKNSTLLIQQASLLKQTMHDEINSDMIARSKRQLAAHWLKQVNQAQSLSKYLVRLNAYELAVNELDKNLAQLESWDEDRWETVSKQLLSPLTAGW